MPRKADEPLCLRCGEDSEDMVERARRHGVITTFCKTCGLVWQEAEFDLSGNQIDGP